MAQNETAGLQGYAVSRASCDQHQPGYDLRLQASGLTNVLSTVHSPQTVEMTSISKVSQSRLSRQPLETAQRTVTGSLTDGHA